MSEGIYPVGEIKADWSKKPSNWHTGTPTEEDLKDINKDNKYCFALCLYYDRWWLSDYLFKVNMEEKCFETATKDENGKPHKIHFADSVVWQKIEPYKEKKSERIHHQNRCRIES